MKVCTIPWGPLWSSTSVVNCPSTGSDKEMVVGYVVTVPWAQSGSQSSYPQLPPPTADVAVHVTQVMPVTMSPLSPEK